MHLFPQSILHPQHPPAPCSLFLTIFFLFLLYRFGVQVTPILDDENSTYSFITNLLLLHSMNFHQWFTFTHASWSISVEWWMYMIFPFLVAPVMKLSKPGRLVIIALCIAGYLVIGFLLVQLSKTGIDLSNISMLTSWQICMGFILFLLFVAWLSYRFIELPARNYINKRWGKPAVQPVPAPFTFPS